MNSTGASVPGQCEPDTLRYGAVLEACGRSTCAAQSGASMAATGSTASPSLPRSPAAAAAQLLVPSL